MIRFREELKYIPGFVHGLQHPGVNGIVEVDPAMSLDVAQRTWLTRLLGIEDITFNSTHTEPGASVHFLLSAFVSWQQRLRIITPDFFYLSQSLGGEGLVHYQFVLPYSLPVRQMTRALAWMAKLVAAARESESIADSSGLQAEFSEFTGTLQPYMAASVNRYRLAEAAFRLSIPIAPKRGDIYQLGIGCRRRLVSSSITDATPAISVSIARNKIMTADLLRQAGFPAPQHLVARDAAQATAHAQQLGFPVVVKPADQEEGRGVAAGLDDDDAVNKAFLTASALSSQVLVEKHVPGNTHRLTVF
ncbi:MAG: acetate--CoA ligase family protein, partial [Gammaproteobacteria bacterium]